MRCPLLNKKCIEKECSFWMEFHMKEPVTQKVSVESSCAIPRIPLMLIHLIRATEGGQTTNEQLRNRMEQVIDGTSAVVQSADRNNRILAGMAELSMRSAELKELPLADPEGN